MQHFAGQRLTLLLCLATCLLLAVIPSSVQADDINVAAAKIAASRVGFDGRYKIGHWTPIWVRVDRQGSTSELVVEVTANDSDGIGVTTSAPLAASSDEACVFAKIGRIGSSIRVKLIAGERTLDEATLRPGVPTENAIELIEMPAASELLVSIETSKFGLQEAFPNRPASVSQLERRTVNLTNIAALPTKWWGYDGANVVILSAGDGQLCRELAADPVRLGALTKWVFQGGRLVVLCGGKVAGDLLREGSGLATLAPGKFVQVVPLAEAGALERYVESESAALFHGSPRALTVPQLENAAGRVELFGAAGNQLPLVVRSPRGFGEITFVGLDLDVPPLSEWPGRTPFLRNVLRPFVKHNDELKDTSRNLTTSGYSDLSGALRQRLGQSFAGVRPFSFSKVVALCVLYLLALGPLNYLLSHKLVRRPLIAWVVFPLILLVFGGGAILLAGGRDQSTSPALNKVELVDVDVATRSARGTYWSNLYSPLARRYDLHFEPRYNQQTPANAESLLSWNGLAGMGIGGMSISRNEFGLNATSYQQTQPDTLSGIPILNAATKSLEARWNGELPSSEIDASLNDSDGLLAGNITNKTGVALRNARLLYGTWAYRLRDVEPAAQVVVDERLTPIGVQTLITGAAIGGGANDRAALDPDQASTAELLNVMMFYEAAGGPRYARLPYRYESFCDLSQQLTLGRAILVANVQLPGSRLTEAESKQPLGAADNIDTSVVVYRFVLPVRKGE